MFVFEKFSVALGFIELGFFGWRDGFLPPNGLRLFMSLCCSFCWCCSIYVDDVVSRVGFGSMPPLKMEDLRVER